MAWHGVYSESANEELEQILKETPGINTISPRWFYFQNTDGDLITLGSADYVKKADVYKRQSVINSERRHFDGRSVNQENIASQ